MAQTGGAVAEATPPLKHLTLLLLQDAPRARVLLGLKKRGFGAGKLNGFGGKVDPGETVLAAALREMREESGLRVRGGARYAAHLTFAFVGQRERMSVHVLTARRWEAVAAGEDAAAAAAADAAANAASADNAVGAGANDCAAEPVESDEMQPQWFPTAAVPFERMWLDDRHWLPHVLAGRRVRGFFLLRGHEAIERMELDADVPPGAFDGAELAVPVPAGAPPQAGIAPGFGADAGALTLEGAGAQQAGAAAPTAAAAALALASNAPTVPLHFVVAAEDARRPPVSFSSTAGAASSIARGATLRVRGCSERGWVFCGLLQGGCGEPFAVAGGAVKLVGGFSGDDCNVELDVTHDGKAAEVVVTYSTRAD